MGSTFHDSHAIKLPLEDPKNHVLLAFATCMVHFHLCPAQRCKRKQHVLLGKWWKWKSPNKCILAGNFNTIEKYESSGQFPGSGQKMISIFETTTWLYFINSDFFWTFMKSPVFFPFSYSTLFWEQNIRLARLGVSCGHGLAKIERNL